MQSISYLFISIAFFAITNQIYGENNNIISISSGTSFGKCIGHCRQSATLMADPLQVITSREANFNQASYPPAHVRSPLNLADWINLINIVDLDIFQKLDDRIGCPDCADMGSEWIQIDWKNGSKRVTFQNGSIVKEIEKLILTLRQIRKIYLSKM